MEVCFGKLHLGPGVLQRSVPKIFAFAFGSKTWSSKMSVLGRRVPNVERKQKGGFVKGWSG